MRPILRHTLEGPVKDAVSSVGDIVFGSEAESRSRQSSSSTPRDMTPTEFRGLRQPTADQLQQLFASGGGQTFQGPFSADLTGNEQALLDQAMQVTQNGTMNQASQQALQQFISGQNAVNVPQVAQMNPLTGLVDVQGIQGGTMQGEANPFLRQAIEAAQRPLIQQFQDEIAPALRAQFASAGQQIQGQGSSPFQMAAARAQSGIANALGDIGAEMSFQDFSQRQQLGSQEFQQLRDLIVGQNLEGRGQELQQMLTGRGQDIEQRGQDLQAGLQNRQQQLDAVAQGAQIERAQLENVLANLEAQALPRLVEQFGIDRGLEEFRRREEQLLQAIQMAGSLGSPTVANVSRSTGSSSSTGGREGLIQPIAQGFGQFLGSGGF